MILRSITLALLLGLGSHPAIAAKIDPEGRIAAAAGPLREAAAASNVGYETLAELCDNYGHRLSGTQTLEDAIDWAAGKMREFGFVNVHKEPVEVPVWVRNEESLEILTPAYHRLAMLGLGRSVGTTAEGITAAVTRVSSFEELDALPDESIAGRIVLFDAHFEGYGETVRYRSGGASAAALRGAVAVLIRSVGLDGMRTPHTGALRYADDAPRIPAAAISYEDANLITRMIERDDEVRVHLRMGAETREDTISHNLIGELRGHELPDEFVVVGGHIDSWDVGQGAQDDGVGCILSMEAVRLIHELALQPRRTLRVVLWTNEENGLRGGRAYAADHADEASQHFAAMESDMGNGRISGFRFDLREAALNGNGESDEEALEAARQAGLQILEEFARLLAPLDASELILAGSGADIGPLATAGVPALGVHHDAADYFRIHHTGSDTFDRINAADLRSNAAVMAIMLYALAEMDASLRP
jgi:carboxypeptidase Q